jgi:tetratricopeptide (TPR) repeat protein
MYSRSFGVRKYFSVVLLSGAAWAQAPSQPFSNNFNNSIPSAPAANPAPAPPRPNALSPEMRGDIFMARKMFREAAEMYAQMPQNYHLTWNKIGIAYHQMAQLNLAKKSYEKAVKLNPTYAEAINNLGTVAYAQKSYRRATNHYKKAIAIAPASASMHSNLGTAYFARKKYEEASESYKKALELDPNVFEHRGSNGTVLQERSVEERAKFHYYLAKLYAKGGQNERALQYLRKALEEGYKDRAKIAEDDAFALLKENPEFQTILKTEYRAL